MKRRMLFGSSTIILLSSEIMIGIYAIGWIRNYLGDVLVVSLLYTLIRTVIIKPIKHWWILPTLVLAFAFGVEFLQLWGFCDRFGIDNRFLRIIMGTRFSVGDLLCYAIGCVPCFIAEYLIRLKPCEGVA